MKIKFIALIITTLILTCCAQNYASKEGVISLYREKELLDVHCYLQTNDSVYILKSTKQWLEKKTLKNIYNGKTDNILNEDEFKGELKEISRYLPKEENFGIADVRIKTNENEEINVGIKLIDGIYYIKEDTLYKYNEYGIVDLIKREEFKYNSKNIFDVYIKED